MHSKLCKLPSHTFYDGLLLAESMDGQRKTGEIVHVAGTEKKSKGSWSNWDEIVQVQTIVDLLCSTDEALPSEITVLTPYRIQSPADAAF